MPPPVKETIDLSLLDRFDAATGSLQLKVSKTGICLMGLSGEALPTRRVALYASRPSKTYLVAAIGEDANGYTLKDGKRGLSCACARFVRTLEERGAQVPQTSDLAWDADAQAYVARLKLAAAGRYADASAAKPGLMEAT